MTPDHEVMKNAFMATLADGRRDRCEHFASGIELLLVMVVAAFFVCTMIVVGMRITRAVTTSLEGRRQRRDFPTARIGRR